MTYQCTIKRYHNSLQFMCLAILENEDDSNLMEKLVISINLNIATCWLKLKEFESAKCQFDVPMKLDLLTVKTI